MLEENMTTGLPKKLTRKEKQEKIQRKEKKAKSKIQRKEKKQNQPEKEQEEGREEHPHREGSARQLSKLQAQWNKQLRNQQLQNRQHRQALSENTAPSPKRLNQKKTPPPEKINEPTQISVRNRQSALAVALGNPILIIPSKTTLRKTKNQFAIESSTHVVPTNGKHDKYQKIDTRNGF